MKNVINQGIDTKLQKPHASNALFVNVKWSSEVCATPTRRRPFPRGKGKHAVAATAAALARAGLAFAERDEQEKRES